MADKSSIKRELLDNLTNTRKVYEEASKGFVSVMRSVPSGIPHPDGSTRIKNAGKEEATALQAYVQALRDLHEFAVRGTIPDYLKDRE